MARKLAGIITFQTPEEREAANSAARRAGKSFSNYVRVRAFDLPELQRGGDRRRPQPKPRVKQKAGR